MDRAAPTCQVGTGSSHGPTASWAAPVILSDDLPKSSIDKRELPSPGKRTNFAFLCQPSTFSCHSYFAHEKVTPHPSGRLDAVDDGRVMPPFISRKRSASPHSTNPAKRRARTTIDPKIQEVIDLVDTTSDSSLSDADISDEFEDVKPAVKKQDPGSKKTENVSDDSHEQDDDEEEGEGEDDDEVDWEDAIDQNNITTTTTNTTTPVPHQDLELTLDPGSLQQPASLLDTKKGPSKIEREIRLNTHRMHVQCLLFHNALRNSWINDSKVHEILKNQLPAGIQKEIQSWRVASALDDPSSSLQSQPQPSSEDRKGKKAKSSKKNKADRPSRNSRDWGNGASRLEPGKPDMSRGDPILSLLRILAAYWKKRFKITAPGLRKRGYRPMRALEADISTFQKGEFDVARHGERIRDRDEFHRMAEKCEGSRDVGAQLFTALLRALGIEARLVANLQPLGFGWTKAELGPSKTAKNEKDEVEDGGFEKSDNGDFEDDSSEDDAPKTKRKASTSRYDNDLPFPIYWTEVISPVTHEVIPVDALVLPNPVATSPELVNAFEPRGARADKAKQVLAYVVAHSSDGTAKDVTTRYLRRRTWPGKTKGFRLPMEKIAIISRRGGRPQSFEYDWFKLTMRTYTRSQSQRTVADDLEEAKDLVPNQPEKKVAKEGDTLQSLRSSEEFVLERFLRREEALRPTAQHVRTFVTGKGDKAKEEKVFLRKDVLKCLSAESWHKEGRQVRLGETPLKRVPIRAVTLMRKREVDELERETGEKPLQGLYARYQTEWIVPPPIKDGIIPKNEYGNIDCFVPSMVPQGAAHIPYNGTVRVCRKLGIDFAEAVTGFEFGSKMAVPVISGVVVAEENAELVVDAWRADQKARREKERLQQEKRILQTWRKFLMGLRIAERVRAEYGDGGDAETHNPFAKLPKRATADEQQAADFEETHPDEDLGGGFLLPGESADEDDFIVEHENPGKASLPSEEEEEIGEDYDEEESPFMDDEEEDADEFQPRRGSRKR